MKTRFGNESSGQDGGGKSKDEISPKIPTIWSQFGGFWSGEVVGRREREKKMREEEEWPGPLFIPAVRTVSQPDSPIWSRTVRSAPLEIAHRYWKNPLSDSPTSDRTVRLEPSPSVQCFWKSPLSDTPTSGRTLRLEQFQQAHFWEF